VRARLDRLAKCDSEQARAKQHKAGCGYREESIGYEIMITHGSPAARELVTVTSHGQQDFKRFRKSESD
jgi:hypothetical protein